MPTSGTDPLGAHLDYFRIADKNEAAGAADASRGIILDRYAGVKIFSLLCDDRKRS